MSPASSPAAQPERAVIGFFLYVSSIFAFGIFILWAYLPNEWFENIGISYYPHKYWSITIALLIMAMVFGIVIGYFLINNFSVPLLDSVSLIKDRYTRQYDPSMIDRDRDVIPPISDLEPAFVSRKLYLSNTS